MKRIGRKLGSNRGASITFALLLFLVCAVISSVVIVAGTAAGGRLKNLAATDQRYYAVNSAAELMKNAIDGKSVAVRKKIVTEKVFDQDNNPVEPATPAESIPSYYIDDSSVPLVSADGLTMLGEMACKIAKVDKESTIDFSSFKPKRFFTLGISGSLGDTAADAAVAVDVYEQMEENGTITLYISKGVDSGVANNKSYTVKLVFAADIVPVTDSKMERGSPENVTVSSDGSTTTYKITETTTDIEVTTITWRLVSVAKSSVPSDLSALKGA